MGEEIGWLQISTEGFAAFNQARPPGHLVKELVQNAFDALGDAEGDVSLDYEKKGHALVVRCRDNGCGLDDLSALRMVYLTNKTDSHLKRGRFGRGFKEILSIATRARAVSGGEAIDFYIADGARRMRRQKQWPPFKGTLIEMSFNWPADTIEALDGYFAQFLPPETVRFKVNGRDVPGRLARHFVEATLTTEVYDAAAHAWRKPTRKTDIELIATKKGEEPLLYEMGIPVSRVEWTQPYHVNILQRVPMNPNRDALASGYAVKVHAACLPTLLADMEREEVTADWVGSAGARSEPDVQREIVVKAFGKTAVRAVPAMGKRDYNDDAMRTGAKIVHTTQMSSGFREMARNHLPSAKIHVDHIETARAELAVTQRVSPRAALELQDERRSWIERRGGKARVELCVAFAVWFCQHLIDTIPHPQIPVTGHVALGRGPPVGSMPFQAHWSAQNQLTLALEEDCIWADPFGADALTILVHEAAHAMNLHHGRSFNEEVERLAGVAAALMFAQADHVRATWGVLLSRF